MGERNTYLVKIKGYEEITVLTLRGKLSKIKSTVICLSEIMVCRSVRYRKSKKNGVYTNMRGHRDKERRSRLEITW